MDLAKGVTLMLSEAGIQGRVDRLSLGGHHSQRSRIKCVNYPCMLAYMYVVLAH